MNANEWQTRCLKSLGDRAFAGTPLTTGGGAAVLVTLVFPLLLFGLVLVLARVEARVVPWEELSPLDADEAADVSLAEMPDDVPIPEPRPREAHVKLTVEPTARARHRLRVGDSTARSTRRTRQTHVGPWRPAA